MMLTASLSKKHFFHSKTQLFRGLHGALPGDTEKKFEMESHRVCLDAKYFDMNSARTLLPILQMFIKSPPLHEVIVSDTTFSL